MNSLLVSTTMGGAPGVTPGLLYSRHIRCSETGVSASDTVCLPTKEIP